MPADPAAALVAADEARRVWRAVLRQQWFDAGGHDPALREAVRRWLATRAFIEVCDLAGFVPSKVARELLLRLASPIETRFNRRSWENARRARQRKRAEAAVAA